MFDTFGPIVVVIVFGAIIGMDKRDRIKEIEFKGYLSDIQRYELFTLTTDMSFGSQKVHCFAVREWRVGGKEGGRFDWVKCWPEGVHNDATFCKKFFAQWTIKLPTCNQIHFSCSLTLLFGKVHRGMHFEFLNKYS